MRRFFPWASLVCTILISSLAIAKPVLEKPKIYLEKKVIAEKKGEEIRFFELYRLKKGDSLWRIFVDKLGGRPEEFSLFLREFKRANPDIQDPSRIAAGKKVKIPVNVGTLPKRKKIEKFVAEGKLRRYKVKTGDNLWKIALTDFGTTFDVLKYIQEVKSLNPFIKNPNRIYPGQDLLLPTRLYFQEEMEPAMAMEESEEPELAIPEKTATAPEPEKEAQNKMVPVEKVLPEKPSREEEAKIAKEPQRLEPLEKVESSVKKAEPVEKPKKTIEETPPVEPAKLKSPPAKSPALPEKTFEPEKEVPVSAPAAVSTVEKVEEEEEVARKEEVLPYVGLLGDVLSYLGEKLVEEGQMFFPLEGGGEIVLDMSKFPLVRFSSGPAVILDYFGAIPPEVADIIASSWQGYTIYSPESREDPVELIRGLLIEGGYHDVKRGNESQLTIGDKIRLSLDVDLIILKDEDSLLKGEVYAVKKMEANNMPEDLARVFQYSSTAGITVLPFYHDAALRDGFVLSYADQEMSIGEREKLPDGLVECASRVLELLGVRRSRNEVITIKGQGGAFTLTVRPDLVFWVGGKPFVLDPERFTEPVRVLIEKKGFKVVRFRKKARQGEVLKRLLKMSGIAYNVLDDDIIGGGEGKGYTIAASGILVKGAELPSRSDEDLLFVNGPVDSGMRWLLSDLFHLRVVTYR